MRSCLATETRPWVVLGVRDREGRYLAFLPLIFRRFPRSGPQLTSRVALAGSPRADFTGMLGVCGEESRYIPPLANALATLPWDALDFSDCADPRIVLLVGELARNGYGNDRRASAVCPYADLPSTWEKYLDSRSRATRRTIRWRLRKIESLPNYRFHFASPADVGEAIESLLRLNSLRWKRDLQESRGIFGDLFAQCYELGRFQISSIYQGDDLMASQGSFIEPERHTIVGYMTGYNAEYAHLSPGFILACASIRSAIERGFRRYEFARGDQTYKLSLATGVRHNANIIVWQRSGRGAALRAATEASAIVKRAVRRLSTARRLPAQPPLGVDAPTRVPAAIATDLGQTYDRTAT